MQEGSTFGDPFIALVNSTFVLISSFGRSLKRSLNKSKYGRIMMVYFTNSSTQSTRRSRFPPAIKREPPSSASLLVNSSYAFGTDDWFGVVNIRIQRPNIRRLFTVLNDCEPPETIAKPRVRPWVGLTDPEERGIQSIWFLNTAVCTLCGQHYF